MKTYLRVHEVATQLKVSPSTVRRYVNEGILKSDLTPFGHRVFTKNQVDDFLGVGTEKSSPQQKAYYARSSDGDTAKIKAQFRLLENEYGEPEYSISDKASGLNDKRKGLSRLFSLARDKKITDIYVTQPDRLTRFGLPYLKELFDLNDVKIHFLEGEKDKSPQEELLQDFMSLVASFSGKFYRLRGYEQQNQLIEKARRELSGEQKTS